MRAGFAEIDITPPVGVRKIGWLREIIADEILDPLFARVAVFESEGERIGLVQLDTLSIRWSDVRDIRASIEQEHGVPGGRVMVAATHNHCGPAVCRVGVVPRNDGYVDGMVQKVVGAFGSALAAMEPAELGFAHVFEFAVGFNRRVRMRDGTVRTHGRFTDPECLCMEGPIDPEVAVLAARRTDGGLLGCVVNFACHPAHHGGTGKITAGYPGVLSDVMKRRGCPMTVFLNGPSGNIATSDPVTGTSVSMEDAGTRLADDAGQAMDAMTFSGDWPQAAAQTTVDLPYREVTDEQIAGTVRGAQRFVDPKLYDLDMPGLVERIRARGTQPAEVQVLFLGNLAFAGIPAEYFVEHGLRIKTQSYPAHALVVGHANGMVGYVPTAHAFGRGGYETTFAPSSRMAPEAGDLLADAAIKLIRERAKQ